MRPTVKVWRQHFDGFESDLVVRPDAVNPLDASSPAVLWSAKSDWRRWAWRQSQTQSLPFGHAHVWSRARKMPMRSRSFCLSASFSK
jgi:hypothetical protein